ncbi:MAG: hypothetical protein ACKO1J_10305 [Tagaea sp.]
MQGDARLADAFDALEYLIVRTPLQGMRFDERLGGLYIIVSSDAGVAGMPRARVVYRFNDECVLVLMASC